MEDKITVLKEFAQECGKIVFFGGAGVSTESGIPDFRSQDGLIICSTPFRPKRF